MKGPYDDMLDLPYHGSSTRPRMPRKDRAAQFAPFAALTGYGAAVKETARLTDARIELDETRRLELNDKLLRLMTQKENETAIFTYFVPDDKKDGGSYQTVRGRIKKFDTFKGQLILTSGDSIPIEEIYDIEMTGGAYAE